MSGFSAWPQSQNSYTYATNNPVLRVDPNGLQCCILSWKDPYPAFFPFGDPHLIYEPWDLPWPGPISIAELELGLVPLPEWLPIDIAEITLWEAGDFELWMRYIRRVQDGESWQTRTCLLLKEGHLSLQWEKMRLVDANVTLVLATWRQEMAIVSTGSSPPRHIGLGWNVVGQPGPWDSSEELDVSLHSNGVWPYENLKWW